MDIKLIQWIRLFVFVISHFQYGLFQHAASTNVKADVGHGFGWNGLIFTYQNAKPCSKAPCLNEGVCVPHSHSAVSYTCQCLPGYTGKHCELGVDECASSPCVHGACIDNIRSFKCHCLPGFTGALCDEDINECLSSPCQNGGTCQEDIPGFFKCLCPPGFRGMRCETDINECLALSPCQNRGRCRQGAPGTYVCDCLDGFTGTDCEREINQCRQDSCRNGGLCVGSKINGNSTWCKCARGFIGAQCERYDPCFTQPCLNNGTCAVLGQSSGGFNCTCAKGFTGPLCQNEIPPLDGGPMTNAYRLDPRTLLAILGILLGLGTFLLVAGCILKRTRKQKPADFLCSFPRLKSYRKVNSISRNHIIHRANSGQFYHASTLGDSGGTFTGETFLHI